MKIKFEDFINESKGVPNILKKIIKDIKIIEGNQIIYLHSDMPLGVNLNIIFNFSDKKTYNGNINYDDVINSNFENIKIKINILDKEINYNKVKETLLHELTHLYEIFKIKNIIGNWEKLKN